MMNFNNFKGNLKIKSSLKIKFINQAMGHFI